MYIISSNNIIENINHLGFFKVKLFTNLKIGDYELISFAVTNQLYNVINNINNIFIINVIDKDIITELKIILPEGYYTIGDLINKINNIIQYELTMNYKNNLSINVSYSNISGKIIFNAEKCKIKLKFNKLKKTHILLGFRLNKSEKKNFLEIIKSDNVIDIFHLNTFVGVTIKESLLKSIKLSNHGECNWIFPMMNSFQSKIIYKKKDLPNPELKLKKEINHINIKFQNQDGNLLKNIDQWTIILKKK